MAGGSPRLYLETVRRLRAEQVLHQVQRRLGGPWTAKRQTRVPRPLSIAAGWGPRVRRCRAEVAGDVLAGRFRFWNVERQLDLSRPWLAPELGRSWNYPVHYFDALPLLAESGRDDPVRARDVSSFLLRWIAAHPPGTMAAWEPYPTALRLVNWIDTIHVLGEAADADWRECVLTSMHVQAGWLCRRLERHLLGTHLLKDVKALLVAASVFATPDAQRWRRVATPLLMSELRAHVGADGAHVEPSLMYHCTALEDVLDLLNFTRAVDDAVTGELQQTAQRMLDVAEAVRTPVGTTPLLGDAWLGGAPRPADLLDYAARLGLASASAATAGVRLFPAAGILVWRDRQLFATADVGGMGPPHLSGHGHCDSLSFELWNDGVPFIVDSGTWSYESGALRHACRSTRAHNTLEIDGREQHEIWAAFRVARRSMVRVVASTESGLEAVLVPWFDKSLRVQRRFECAADELRIIDHVDGPGVHRVVSRLHLHPECRVESAPEGLLLRRGRARLSLSWRREPTASTAGEWAHVLPEATSGSHFALRAGEMQPNAVVQLVYEGPMPFASAMRIRRLEPL